MKLKELTSKELKNIATKLEKLEHNLLIEYGLHRISGGFCTIDMEDYDNDKIYVVITDGVQSDVQNTTNITNTSLWRNNLEWTD